MSETLAVCSICAQALGADLDPGAPAWAPQHRACRERREQERRRKACERYVTEQLLRIKGELPGNPHARVGAPTFATKCRCARLRGFAESHTFTSGSALLSGRSGVGKTTAAVALVRRLIDEGITAGAYWHEMDRDRFDGPSGPRDSRELARASRMVWTTARAIVNARRMHPLGEGEPPLLEQVIGASLVVVDEWGSEGPDTFGDFFAVVDARANEGLPTIVTSGLTLAELNGRYGEALVRRLTEQGLGRLIEAK